MKLVFSCRCLYPGHTLDACIDHEPEQVLDIVESQDPRFSLVPKPLVVERLGLGFQSISQLRDMPRFRHRDLQVVGLLVPLKPIDVFSHRYLDGLDDGWELPNFRLQEGTVRVAVFFRKTNGGGNINVMLETGNVEQY